MFKQDYFAAITYLPTGEAVIVYTNGNTYQGECKNDQPDGYGCMKYAHNRMMCRGRFVNGQFPDPGLFGEQSRLYSIDQIPERLLQPILSSGFTTSTHSSAREDESLPGLTPELRAMPYPTSGMSEFRHFSSDDEDS
jgi:hypothetical protein